MGCVGSACEVVTHAIGGVCCSSGIPLGDREECVASLEVLT
jgi:hypothetical protein